MNNAPSRSALRLDACHTCHEHFGSGGLWSDQKISVLGIAISKHDDQLLETLAHTPQWILVMAGSLTESLSVVTKYRIGVVLLNRNILGIDWKDALHLFLQPSHHSSVLLVNNTVNQFCEAFIEEGGYGVLLSPMTETQAIDQVQRAWSAWISSVARPYGY